MNSRPNKNNKGKKGNKASSRGRQSVPMSIERAEHPPQIDGYQITHKTRLRFTVTAAVTNQLFTVTQVGQTMCVATTAIAGFCLFDVFRIKRVQIWGIAAQGTPTTVQVQFSPISQLGDANIHTDTSLGVKPAYISAAPSRFSLASLFQNVASANDLFSVTAPAGSIIDLSLSYRTSSNAPVALTNALVGANPGEFYFRGLDSLATAGTNFPPPNGVQVI
jgi:hypothetical protein